MSKFKVGDRVRIKSWKQMKEEFGLDTQRDIDIYPSFVKDMRNLCGETATITDIDGEYVTLDDWSTKSDTSWNYSTDMIEKFDEDEEYISNIKKGDLVALTCDIEAFALKEGDILLVTDYDGGNIYRLRSISSGFTCGISREKLRKINKNSISVNYIGKEEKEDMENEVLELWYERKRKEIGDDCERRYKVFKEKGNDFLAKYNDLLLEVNEKLDSLVKEDTLYNEEQLLSLNTSFTGLKYKLNEDDVYSLFEKENYHIFDIQLDELNKTYEEVKAQLSLSNDLEYQLKVLKNYGIIDKKNKLSA